MTDLVSLSRQSKTMRNQSPVRSHRELCVFFFTLGGLDNSFIEFHRCIAHPDLGDYAPDLFKSEKFYIRPIFFILNVNSLI